MSDADKMSIQDAVGPIAYDASGRPVYFDPSYDDIQRWLQCPHSRDNIAAYTSYDDNITRCWCRSCSKIVHFNRGDPTMRYEVKDRKLW